MLISNSLESNDVARRNGASAVRLAEQSYQRDLGQSLLLRWSTLDDLEQLVAMFSNVMRSAENSPPNHFRGTGFAP